MQYYPIITYVARVHNHLAGRIPRAEPEKAHVPPRHPRPSDAPAKSQPLLDAVEKQLGVVPNLFRLVGTSPAALEGYLGLNGALGRSLDAKTRERIALAVAQANGCDYCLSAHSYLGLNLAKIDAAEIALNRTGHSGDARADAALVFARQSRSKRAAGSAMPISPPSASPAFRTRRSSRSSPMSRSMC